MLPGVKAVLLSHTAKKKAAQGGLWEGTEPVSDQRPMTRTISSTLFE
jgi:hypothetical protein